MALNKDQMSDGVPLDEFIDKVQSALTMSGALPCYLSNAEIERIVRDEAMPWFYWNYHPALERGYVFIPKETLKETSNAGEKYTVLPKEVRSVIWTKAVNDRSLFQVGINAPGMSINMGVANQPFLTSFMTSVGEIGIYKVIIDSFADVLNSLTKNTIKSDYNPNSNVYKVLTSIGSDITTGLVLECYMHIAPEALFKDNHFIRYVIALSRIQLANLISFNDMPLPGSVKLNAAGIQAQGESEKEKVETAIKEMTNSGWFFMTRR